MRRTILLIACISLLFLSSCTSKASKESGSVTYDSSLTTASSSNTLPSQYRNIDINKEAATLSAQPGQVAIALIICKLDNTKVLEELVKQDSHALFDLLNETALQRSQTLESLDDQYDLTEILASLNINVSIKSNTVTSMPTASSGNTSWVAKFQQAINAG